MNPVTAAIRRLDSPTVRRWILFAFLASTVAGLFTYIRASEDFGGYLAVGELVLEGRHIYSELPPGINTWPPLFSLLCAPLAFLARATPYLARGFWILFNCGAFLLTLHLIARLLYGKALSLRAIPGEGRLSLAEPELFVPVLLSGYYIIGNFEHLQINIILFALTLGGLYLQATGRERAGGIALGCGAAIKVLPVIFIPYLIYRRRFRPAAYAIAAAALLSLSPALVFGWNRFLDYAAAWRDALSVGWSVGKMNQSLFAMWDRFLGHGMVPFLTPGDNFLLASGDPFVKTAWLLSLTAAAVLGLVFFRGKIRPDSEEAIAEWSIVFLVAALFGTVSWKAFLIVLLLPNALLFKVWLSPFGDRGMRRTSGSLLVVVFMLGWPTGRDIAGRHLHGMLEMASCITFAGLIMMGGMFWLRVRLGNRLKSEP